MRFGSQWRHSTIDRTAPSSRHAARVVWSRLHAASGCDDRSMHEHDEVPPAVPRHVTPQAVFMAGHQQARSFAERVLRPRLASVTGNGTGREPCTLGKQMPARPPARPLGVPFFRLQSNWLNLLRVHKLSKLGLGCSAPPPPRHAAAGLAFSWTRRRRMVLVQSSLLPLSPSSRSKQFTISGFACWSESHTRVVCCLMMIV